MSGLSVPGHRRPAGFWLGLLLQTLLIGLCVALILWLFGNAFEQMRARGMQAGFSFLLEPAGFDISETPLVYDPAQPFWRAFLVGLLNTLRVALPALVLATVLGVVVGVARLSSALPVRVLAALYVEVFRNVPLLLQLFMGYFVLSELLPAADAPLSPLPGVWLSRSGLALPWWGADGLDWPQRGTFGIEGGAVLTPEYLTLLVGLASYTAAYIAEIVRGGIQAVPRGQTEAARALGLRPVAVLRHVVLPQALKAIVPPLGNQYLNGLKNASLAVAIGYPDLVSVSNTALNQTGRALECIAVMMALYLGLSLLVAGVMRQVNQHMALRGLRP